MATGRASDVDFEKLDFESVLTMKNYISKGTFGAVYGPFTWNSKEFAVKHILIGQDKPDDFKTKVEVKKNIWTSLKHENLIEIHYVSLNPKSVYIVMEYASGGSLRQLLDKSDINVHRQMDVSSWSRQIAEGMLYLHNRGIVHRDLKTSNIVLMEPFDSMIAHLETTLKITDFDTVQEHAGTAELSFRGTIAYMAPEVLTTEMFSTASDVWSYGVVMWEMLTRELPHKGQAIVPLTKKASTGQLTLPIPESTPKEFQELLRGCWCHDTKSRLRFKAIIDRLNSICESENSTVVYERKPCAEEKKQLEKKFMNYRKNLPNMVSEDFNICRHSMAVRRELPCKHILCLDCVKNMKEKANRSDHLSCPNCIGLFSITVVPKDSVDPPQYIREKYKQEIKAAQDVDIKKQNEKIMGMTVVGDELYIVCKSPPEIIFKYNIGAENKGTFKPIQLSISEVKWPRGIAGSDALSCLYITDWHKTFGGRLWRYKYQKGQEAQQEEPVARLDVQPFGVSVSQKTEEVLVTCATPSNIFAKRGWIYIYKPNGADFPKIRTIELTDLEIPRHSILTPLSKFIVCHGWNNTSHGVTSYLDDETGLIRKKSFYGKVAGGGNGEQEMNRPLSMFQDEDGLILVVDYYNNRIQLLTEDLHLVRHLIISGITYPRHICLHAKTGRMYVGQEDGTVQIFDALILKE